MITEKIARSIAAKIGATEALDALAERISASELAAVLLHIHQARSRKVTFAKVLEQQERAELFAPSVIDARTMNAIDREAFEAARAFEAIELSPVSPFGLNALAGIPQNNVLSALRASEVLADPTTQKAVEAARRRRTDRDSVIRLCGSHRLVRMQPFPKGKGYTRHFKIFTMVTAGRDSGDEKFEREAIKEHFAVYLDLFRRLERLGYQFQDRRIFVADSRPHDERRFERIETTVFQPLRADFPEVAAAIERDRKHAMGYYTGYAIKIVARDPRGEDAAIGDGGFTTWTQRYLNDQKERFFSSALGSELIPKRFRAP